MIRRIIRASVYFLLISLLAACGTLDTGVDPERPESEIAFLEGYKRYYVLYYEQGDISSVDGKRPGGILRYVNAVKLLPGEHWVEIRLERYVLGGGGPYATCAFKFQFEAQHRYQIEAHSLKADVGLLAHPLYTPYKGSISIEISTPDSHVRTESVTAVCTIPHEALCRQNSDCPSNYPCHKQQDFEFGTCNPDR